MERPEKLLFTLDETEPIRKVGDGYQLTPKGREALIDGLVSKYQEKLDALSDTALLLMAGDNE